ncbi:MAG TPA: rhomboid family intramembrane serine protease, partial [Cyclobacteriaceae bacterium]|nr:rhomboid family intramembrane serine protease [Cyclobacteriaceae bacterium]
MRDLRKAPATLLLLMINVTAFAGLWIDIGTLEGPEWVRGLLLQGAQFAPLSLDTQWYRLFTHMFMHGGVVHLIMNMYALFIVGTEVENLTGTG